MPDPEAVLSEAPPLNALHNISPQTSTLDTTPPEAPLCWILIAKGGTLIAKGGTLIEKPYNSQNILK